MSYKNVSVIENMPFEKYLSDPCPSPSCSKTTILKMITGSPREARHFHPAIGGHRGSNSSRADLGTLAHAALLGPDDRLVEVDAPDWRTKTARDAKNEAYLDGKVPVLSKELGRAKAMAEIAANRFKETLGCDISEATKESSILWQEDGVWCRARPDAITKDRKWIIDYKTASTAHPLAWAKRTVVSGGYDIQNAHYLAAAEAAFGPDDHRKFGFLIQDIEEPHECAFVTLSHEYIQLAQEKRAFALELWKAACNAGHDKMIVEIEPPKWEHLNWLEQEEYLRGISQAALEGEK